MNCHSLCISLLLDDRDGNVVLSGVDDDTDFQTSKCWKVYGNSWSTNVNSHTRSTQLNHVLNNKDDCISSPGDGKVVKNMICQKDLGK